jgi:hypothetical protein
VANLHSRSRTVTDRGIFEILTCSFLVKHVFPFTLCVGKKLGDFFKNRKSAPSFLGAYSLLKLISFGKSIGDNSFPPASTGQTTQLQRFLNS